MDMNPEEMREQASELEDRAEREVEEAHELREAADEIEHEEEEADTNESVS